MVGTPMKTVMGESSRCTEAQLPGSRYTKTCHGRSHVSGRRSAAGHHEVLPDVGRRKFGQEFHSSSHGMRTVQRVDDAVNMVQGKDVQDAVVLPPLPGANQRMQVRRQAAMRVQGSWKMSS